VQTVVFGDAFQDGGQACAIALFERGNSFTKEKERFLGGSDREVENVSVEQSIVPTDRQDDSGHIRRNVADLITEVGRRAAVDREERASNPAGISPRR